MKIDAREISLGNRCFVDDGFYDYDVIEACCSPLWVAKRGGIVAKGGGHYELHDFDVTSVTVRKDGDSRHIEVLGLVGDSKDFRIVRIVFTRDGVEVELGEGTLNFAALHDAVYSGE